MRWRRGVILAVVLFTGIATTYAVAAYQHQKIAAAQVDRTLWQTFGRGNYRVGTLSTSLWNNSVSIADLEIDDPESGVRLSAGDIEARLSNYSDNARVVELSARAFEGRFNRPSGTDVDVRADRVVLRVDGGVPPYLPTLADLPDFQVRGTGLVIQGGRQSATELTLASFAAAYERADQHFTRLEYTLMAPSANSASRAISCTEDGLSLQYLVDIAGDADIGRFISHCHAGTPPA